MVTTHDALSVPVARATPQEIELQGAYHLKNATVTSLKEFVENSEDITLACQTIENVITLKPHADKEEEESYVIWLSQLDNDCTMVLFQGCTSQYTGYGVRDLKSGIIQERSLGVIQMKYGIHHLIEAMRVVKNLEDRLRLARAIARTSTHS